MTAAFRESGKEGFEQRDTERGRLEYFGLHNIIKEINKNMAKKEYTAEEGPSSDPPRTVFSFKLFFVFVFLLFFFGQTHC